MHTAALWASCTLVIAAYDCQPGGPAPRLDVRGTLAKPITIYGCNNCTCEHLGRYYSNLQAAARSQSPRVEFRGSLPRADLAVTVPSGARPTCVRNSTPQPKRPVGVSCAGHAVPFMAMRRRRRLAQSVRPRSRAPVRHGTRSPRSSVADEIRASAFARFQRANHLQGRRTRQALSILGRSFDEPPRAAIGISRRLRLRTRVSQYLIPTIPRHTSTAVASHSKPGGRTYCRDRHPKAGGRGRGGFEFRVRLPACPPIFCSGRGSTPPPPVQATSRARDFRDYCRCGPCVERWREGTRCLPSGPRGVAEYCVAPSVQCLPVPRRSMLFPRGGC